MHLKFEPSVRSQQSDPAADRERAWLFVVSIEPLFMGLVEAKKEAERANCPRPPAG